MVGGVCVTTLSLAPALNRGKPAYTVPYTDSNAKGYIGLCDQNGKAVTSGNINDRPFVWLAVSSSPAAAGFTGFGQTGTLYAYLPRQGSPPGQWTGKQMTATSYYTNAAHPMVAATNDAATLKDFMRSDPLVWDGLVQLRIYVGLPGEGIHNQSYPATDIRVSGNTWTVVRGGDAQCNAGFAVSANVGPPPQSTATLSPGTQPSGGSGTTAPGGPSAGASQPSSSGNVGSTPAVTGTGHVTPTSGDTGTPGAANGPPQSGGSGGAGNGSGSKLAAFAVAAAIGVLIAVVLLVARSRQRRGGENAQI